MALTNSPASISLSLTVVPVNSVVYGTSAQRVSVIDVGGSVAPTVSAVDANNQPIAPGPVTFTSRATSVATVDASGKITGVGAGATWVAATTKTSSDSVYVTVSTAAGGPLVRANLTSYQYNAGDTITASIILDARTTTIGAATLSVGWTTDNSMFLNAAWTTGGPPTPVVNNPLSGVLLVSVASPAGITGAVTVVQLKLVVRQQAKGAAGWLTLGALEVDGTDAASLLSRTTSTRYPIIIR